MCHVADSHPPANIFILVVAPVNGVAHEEKSVMPCKSYEEEEGGEHQPLPPIEASQGLSYFFDLHLPSLMWRWMILSRLIK